MFALIFWIGQRFSYVGDFVHANRWLIYLVGLPVSVFLVQHVVTQVRADRRQHGVPVYRSVVYLVDEAHEMFHAGSERADIEPEKELT